MHTVRLLVLVLAGAAFAASAAGQAPPGSGAPVAGVIAAVETPASEVERCLSCHGKPGQEITLSSGEKLSLSVDADAFHKSSHSRKLACTDCHADLKDVPGNHPARRFATRREFVIRYSDQCQKCHFSNYKDTLDSVHRAQIRAGKLGAAVCSDCHGAHDVSSPSEPRTKISATCATCHKQIAETYTRSVHGKGLSEGNEDVPTCTDCHHSHDIKDPRVGAWRVKEPELCGTCHADAKLMKKYKLSTSVVDTYLSDFHGTTIKLQQGEAGPKPVVALCTDCHGVHDIMRVKDANSPVVKARLLETCKKCHADAKADFPASWLSHYEPSLTKAPLVYLVKLFYMFLIPFMIGGLALQIVLHLWRIVVNR